jgi:hypothetical protein
VAALYGAPACCRLTSPSSPVYGSDKFVRPRPDLARRRVRSLKTKVTMVLRSFATTAAPRGVGSTDPALGNFPAAMVLAPIQGELPSSALWSSGVLRLTSPSWSVYGSDEIVRPRPGQAKRQIQSLKARLQGEGEDGVEVLCDDRGAPGSRIRCSATSQLPWGWLQSKTSCQAAATACHRRLLRVAIVGIQRGTSL